MKDKELKFRFRWRADGLDHEMVIEAPDFPQACYRLGQAHHRRLLMNGGGVPSDFRLDLTRVERVSE